MMCAPNISIALMLNNSKFFLYVKIAIKGPQYISIEKEI